jgi:hypothetical protein
MASDNYSSRKSQYAELAPVLSCVMGFALLTCYYFTPLVSIDIRYKLSVMHVSNKDIFIWIACGIVLINISLLNSIVNYYLYKNKQFSYDDSTWNNENRMLSRYENVFGLIVILISGTLLGFTPYLAMLLSINHNLLTTITMIISILILLYMNIMIWNNAKTIPKGKL